MAGSITSATRWTTSWPHAIVSRRQAPGCSVTANPRSVPTASRSCSSTPRTFVARWLNSNRREAPMSWTTAAAIYFIIWWIVLFAVLPWGIRSQVESGDVVPGTDPGAPAIPRLTAKLAWTTFVATVVFALAAAVYAYRLGDLDDLATLFGLLP